MFRTKQFLQCILPSRKIIIYYYFFFRQFLLRVKFICYRGPKKTVRINLFFQQENIFTFWGRLLPHVQRLVNRKMPHALRKSIPRLQNKVQKKTYLYRSRQRLSAAWTFVHFWEQKFPWKKKDRKKVSNVLKKTLKFGVWNFLTGRNYLGPEGKNL